MFTYRIGQTKYASDRKGSGIDGRWNSYGKYVIYTAGSLALSCLEKLAHTSGTSLYAGDFSVTTYEIPDILKINEIGIDDLFRKNPEWNKVSNYLFTQDIGDNWLKNRQTAVLKVPSAIIEEEFNYLLNPAHPDFSKIRIVGVRKFSFDDRLKAL